MDERRAVTIRSPADIAAALPHLVGFRPSESLVLVALTPPGEQMTFTMRIDLPPAGAADAVAEECAARIARAGAIAVIVAVFSAADDADGSLPHAGLVDAVQRRLPAPVRDAVLIRAGRVWSYLCAEPGCCPVDGTPVDDASSVATAVAAAEALAGRALVPDRDALVREAAAVGGVTRLSMLQACGRALDDGLASAVARYRDVLERALDAAANGPPELAHDDAALLGVSWHCAPLRDELLVAIARGDAGVAEIVRAVARLAPAPYDVPAATMLAWVAYADGCGVVAAAALERALASDPAYPLARLLADALDSQMAPRELRALWAKFGPDDDGEVRCAGGGGRRRRPRRAGGGGDAAARRGRDPRRRRG